MSTSTGSGGGVAGQVLLVVAGSLAGAAAVWLRIPLGWMLGSMVLGAAAAVTLDAPEPPRFLRIIGQMIIGGSIGLTLSPDAVQRIGESGGAIVISAIAMVLAGSLIGLLYDRLTGADRATAIFCCVPGSPIEMAILARANGGDGARVAFAQTVRLFAIVAILPPLMLAGHRRDPDWPAMLDAPDLPGMTALLLASLASALVAHKLRLANAFFLGPMIGLGVLTAGFGAQFPGLHAAVFALAQVLLGISLGTMFRRSFLVVAPRFFLEMLAVTLILILTGFGTAAGLHAAFDLSLPTMVLANAPGAITEMSLTARELGLDVALIVAFQLFRVFLTMIALPLAYARVLARL